MSLVPVLHYGADRNEDFHPAENQQYGPAFDGSMRVLGRVLRDGRYQLLPYSPYQGYGINYGIPVLLHNRISLTVQVMRQAHSLLLIRIYIQMVSYLAINTGEIHCA